MRIMVIEDDMNISGAIKLYLEKEGYKVFQFSDAEEAIKFYKKNKVDLIVTDLNLPGISGEIFTEYIKKEKDIPIIMLTAKSSREQIINGLSIGADDYITKPFSPKELILRIENILRRYNICTKKPLFKDEKLTIFRENNEIEVLGEKCELTNIEYKILDLLINNSNIILSREKIIEKLHGADVYDRVIDAHIKSIRKKINDDSKNPKYIKTVYGAGYKFIGGTSD